MPCEDCSRVDRCSTCGHDKGVHHGEDLWMCSELGCPCEGFALAVPADAETAGEPECTCSSGSPENYEGPARDCPIHGEPAAPEEPACGNCGSTDGTWFDRSVCAEPCGSAHNRCANCGAVTGDACLNEAPQASPRRPPNAVAYVLRDGTHFEIAVSGDANVCALEGALVITHSQSPIKGLVQVKPWGDQ